MFQRNKILAHRGLWKQASEKNTPMALEKALRMGFGLETDIRDCAGEIVISHDMANGAPHDFLSLDALLAIYRDGECDGVLALNVKADGIAHKVAELLAHYQIERYFLFDMSVPELVLYAKMPLRVFGRASEFETYHDTLSLAEGVWVDNFTGQFDQVSALNELHSKGLACALVSPELHGRQERPLWDALKHLPHGALDECMICTDFPEACFDYLVNEND